MVGALGPGSLCPCPCASPSFPRCSFPPSLHHCHHPTLPPLLSPTAHSHSKTSEGERKGQNIAGKGAERNKGRERQGEEMIHADTEQETVENLSLSWLI